MLGEWTIDVITDAMPEKVATAIGKLNETLLGAEYVPIAYLGQQVVNGINHAVLAEQTIITGKDVKNVVLIIFNEKPNTMELALVNIERVVEGGNGAGAVEVDPKTDIPTDAKLAFDVALGGFVGSDVEPFALLATQVTEGINYIFAAEVTPATREPKKIVSTVTVNTMLNSISFTDILEGNSRILMLK
jgi:hypothetical protein